ncbi:hypothetical protein [Bradyrhizobium sp. SEMIA]|uniref:hypothetical protein n=1 Tax=Bradyrhizobium sp. SEMIA TaxID=2597515 RepID=UPI0018A627C5|nr:hypothetical protein [Bradyrhizobium sp. SEMIA]QOG23041.1 hypothetical protein FOM02_43100 [Bradyrhizobium sp. SEMIA]
MRRIDWGAILLGVMPVALICLLLWTIGKPAHWRIGRLPSEAHDFRVATLHCVIAQVAIRKEIGGNST